MKTLFDKLKQRVYFQESFGYQIELLPRFVIIYGKDYQFEDGEITANGFAIEWLWFSLFIVTSKQY